MAYIDDLTYLIVQYSVHNQRAINDAELFEAVCQAIFAGDEKIVAKLLALKLIHNSAYLNNLALQAANQLTRRLLPSKMSTDFERVLLKQRLGIFLAFLSYDTLAAPVKNSLINTLNGQFEGYQAIDLANILHVICHEITGVQTLTVAIEMYGWANEVTKPIILQKIIKYVTANVLEQNNIQSEMADKQVLLQLLLDNKVYEVIALLLEDEQDTHQGMHLTYCEPHTKNTLLHRLILAYAKATAEDRAAILQCIRLHFSKKGTQQLSALNSQGQSPLELAATQSSAEKKLLIDTLLEYMPPKRANADIYEEYARVVYKLVSQGKFLTAQYLLKIGASPAYVDIDGNTLLHKAMKVAQVNANHIKMLLSYFPNIYRHNKRGLTALGVLRDSQLSLSAEAVTAIAALLHNTARAQFNNIIPDLPLNGGNALHGAVRANNAELVKELLARGVPANALDNDKVTPIRLAATLGHWRCVYELIPTKLTTEHDKHIYGEVLRWAVAAQQLALVKLLVARGAAINWCPQNDKPFIPLLHLAVATENEALIKWLLRQKKLDLTALNPAGQTAYSFAQSLQVQTDTWQQTVEELNPLTTVIATDSYRHRMQTNQVSSFLPRENIDTAPNNPHFFNKSM
jgi:ankyrin repeat protein